MHPPIGACVWTLGPELVALFGEVVQPLGAGASLEAGWLVFSILSHRKVTALNLLCALSVPS